MRHAHMRIMRARGERLPSFFYRRGTVVWKKWGVHGDLEMGRLHAIWAWAKKGRRVKKKKGVAEKRKYAHGEKK